MRTPKGRAVALAIYAVLFGAGVLIGHWDEIFGKQECDQVSMTTRIWYEKVATIGYRKPRPHFVRLVALQPPQSNRQFDACQRRHYLATLLPHLSAAGPAVIVLDYRFPVRACEHGETEDLQTAIDNVAKQTPIVFGLNSWTTDELGSSPQPTVAATLKPLGFRPDDQVLFPAEVTSKGPKEITVLDRLDCDTRRLPLQWRVYEQVPGGKWASRNEGSLGLAAATAYDSSIATRVSKYVHSHSNPFTSFIPAERFQSVGSEDVMNASAESQEALRWRIVVVGEINENDVHETVVGRLPGFVLQANYIESLLDDRYFNSSGTFLTAVVTFICLCAVYAIFRKTENPWRALLAGGFLSSLLFLGSYIALVHFAVLLTFWVPTVLAVVTGFVAKLAEA